MIVSQRRRPEDRPAPHRRESRPVLRPVSGSSGLYRLRDWNYLRHFRHLLPEVALDAVLEGHRAARAAVAGAVEADLDDAVGAHVDQLDVAPIRLHGGADQVDDALHLVAR